jgi:hypothetical protein
MSQILDFLYAKKAWVGAGVALVGQYINLVRSVIADDSISFTEAETLINGGMALVVSLGVLVGVFKARNAPVPGNPPEQPIDPPMQARGGF